METVNVQLTGKMPLLMHADNIEWADQMEEWRKDPANKKSSKAGDDRTPSWRWLGCLYYDDPQTGSLAIPAENIMRMTMEGAAQVPTGRGKGTFKSLSQSALLCPEYTWPLLVNGKTIPMEEIRKACSLPKFVDQKKLAESLGFSLFVKRAKVGTNKHVRVRPRFDNWSISGQIVILDEQIDVKILLQILDIGGRFKGLGDWRPSSKTPGQFGTFEAKIL